MENKTSFEINYYAKLQKGDKANAFDTKERIVTILSSAPFIDNAISKRLEPNKDYKITIKIEQC